MDIYHHPLANATMKAPAGMDDCADLPIYHHDDADGHWMISCWQPSPEEIATLAAGGKITLWIHGAVHPVVAMGIITKEQS